MIEKENYTEKFVENCVQKSAEKSQESKIKKSAKESVCNDKKIKILFVTNHFQFVDGVAKCLLNLANNLDIEKFEVTVVALFAVDQKFVAQLSPDVKFVSVFKKYFRGLSKLVGLVPQRLLYKILVKEKYDFEVAYQAGAPTKLLAYSTNTSAVRYAFMHIFVDNEKKYHARYDKIIPIAQSLAERYKQQVTFPQKVETVYNIFDTDKIIRDSKEFAVEKKRFTIVTACRLSPEKGLERLLVTHKKLLKNGFEHDLWLVGGGKLESELKNKIEQLNIASSVTMWGAQRNPYPYIASANLYVCSSFDEGLNTACVEATVCGVPIVTTNVSGAFEIVQEHSVGMVVTSDEDGLYYGLQTAISQPEMMEKWKSNIPQAQEFWKKDNAIKNIEKLFSNQ
ncbi:MAG: glycosyltransferase [Clostridia bacterium]